jgi:hypothetical protein
MAAIANGKAVAWKRMDSTEVDMHLPDVCSGDAFFFSESTESSPEDRVTTIQVVFSSNQLEFALRASPLRLIQSTDSPYGVY